MFFFIFFGTLNRKKVIRQYEKLFCPGCLDLKEAQLIAYNTYFHIFFIPIFKIKSIYYLIFKGCNHNYKILKEKIESIEKDFKREVIENNEEYEFNFKYCRKCDKTFEESYVFCPYCGEKLE